MNRIAFLRQLVGSGLLVTAAPTKLLSRSTTALPLYEGFVAGFQYYQGPEYIDQMAPGQPLDLVREPDNRFDDRAIAVYWESHKIGFLARLDNPLFATMIDQGVLLEARILQTSPTAPHWQKCRMGVSLLYPHQLLRSPAMSSPAPPASPETRPEPFYDNALPTLQTLVRDMPRIGDPDYIWADWRWQLSTYLESNPDLMTLETLVEQLHTQCNGSIDALLSVVDTIEKSIHQTADAPLQTLLRLLRNGARLAP